MLNLRKDSRVQLRAIFMDAISACEFRFPESEIRVRQSPCTELPSLRKCHFQEVNPNETVLLETRVINRFHQMTEHTPLRVAIIGGGIAGLAAARVLREQHDVTVYERNASDTAEAGAAVGLGPNGTKMAKSLGLAKESLKAVVSSGFRTFDQTGALLKKSKNLEWTVPRLSVLSGGWFTDRI